MKNFCAKIFTTFGLLIASSTFSHAQVIVSDAIIEFKHDERLIKEIAVGNASKDTALSVKTLVEEIQNPASEDEKRVETKTVFTTPNQFTLNPRRQVAIRIASNKRTENVEKLYRVSFTPEVQQTEGSESKINTLTTTAVLVIMHPQNPSDELKWVREEDRIIFENAGNTNIVIRRKGLCTKNLECNIPGERLWPTDKWILNLPEPLQTEELILEKRALGKIEEIKIPYEE